MLKKRIIPCLDIQNELTVKGVNFAGICDAGDLIALAARYVRQGADKLVFFDITATVEKRKTAATLAANPEHSKITLVQLNFACGKWAFVLTLLGDALSYACQQ